MKIFQKEFVDYLRPAWPYLLVVALIGLFQVIGVYLVPADVEHLLQSINFLKMTQAAWALAVALSILIMVRKYDFGFLQVLFLGFLYVLAFGFLKIFVRVALSHDLGYLLLGDATRVSPLLESIIYISFITIVVGVGAILTKKMK